MPENSQNGHRSLAAAVTEYLGLDSEDRYLEFSESHPSGDCTHLGSNGTGSDSAPAIVRDLTCTLAKRYQLIRGQALVNFMQTGRPEYFYINRGDRSQAKM